MRKPTCVRGYVVLTALCLGLSPAAGLRAEAADAPAGWTLRFSDDFERAELGADWSATGLTRIDNGVLTVGRENDLGRNMVACTKEFLGAIRLEYDTMAPVDNPCDLSATINGGLNGESSGFFFGFGSQNNTTGRFLIKGQPGKEYPPPPSAPTSGTMSSASATARRSATSSTARR